MHPSIQVLKSKGNVWNYAERDGITEKNIMTGEVDYLEPHGEGKSFYNIGSITPGQTVKVNLGYFVDEDKLDSIFLDAFRYSGFSGNENMNEKKSLVVRYSSTIKIIETNRRKKLLIFSSFFSSPYICKISFARIRKPSINSVGSKTFAFFSESIK